MTRPLLDDVISMISFLRATFWLSTARASFVSLDLADHFNIKAASSGVEDRSADFDGSGRAYPVEWLPSGNRFTYRGIEFTLPPFHESAASDAIRSNAQIITVEPADIVHSFHALATSVWPPTSYAQARPGNLTVEFEDGSADQVGIIVAPWYSDSPFDGPIHTPWHYSNSSLDYNSTIDHNITHIHYLTTRLPNDKPIRFITLPQSNTFINWFSITLQTWGSGPQLSVEHVRSTTKWFGSDPETQQIEVLLDNLAPLTAPEETWITTPVNVWIESDVVNTVSPARLVRLRSNDQVLLRIGVQNVEGVAPGTAGTAKVSIQGVNASLDRSDGWEITAGTPAWDANDDSLATHEAPEWFDDAKFGIFIHWGVYSVPAWAPTGVQYAEWYNWQLHVPASPESPTWIHHRDTYGENVVYDDFIANFTAPLWDPDSWVDLFADAGAKYFVFTSKHHEGFAMFDAGNTTNRSSVIMGPQRDFVGELFASAKARHPHLRRGTYFSLPEWYNPDYEPYGRTKFPGRPALNAFTGQCCDPYLGHIPVDNFVEDLQKPQLEKLMFDYETEILWCDADGRSAFSSLAADWYNFAMSQGRQVTRNNRCGSNQTDFVTPEYATFSAQLSQKWESSAGIDPFSYGYNQDTPAYAYANASDLIVELVDIVSKGGNFLLDIGPKGDGTVVSEQTEPLLEIGDWLVVSGEAIYSTRPWFIQTSARGVRFTTTTRAFYIVAISRPEGGPLQVNAPVPIREGDTVTMIGSAEGQALEWRVENGILEIDVNEEDLNRVSYAWAFKVAYAF